MPGSLTFRARSSERASAIIGAIAVMVIGALIVTAVFSILERSSEREKSRSARAASVPLVDRALASYEYALEAALTDESRAFLLDGTAMANLAANEAAALPVANSTFGSAFTAAGLGTTALPGATYGWSMQVTLPNGQRGWWQPVAVHPPHPLSPNLVVYMRVWTSTGGAASLLSSDPRLIRAELRPGRFSDYQILVDGPLTMGDGMILSGRVHTNGYPDAYLVDQFVKPGYPMKLLSSSPPTCGPGSGFSTATGLIENKGSCIKTGGANPKYIENNRQRYDLLRGSNHLKMLASMCPRIKCLSGSGTWNVLLGGSSATFSGPSGTTTVSAAAGAVVFVRGKVRLRGVLSSGALTIGVGSSAGFNVNGSATVDLIGNGPIGAATTGSAVLGLVVEGDIIPRFDQGSCPTGLTAAVVSASGTLGIPPQFRVPWPSSSSLPTCASTFRFRGSLGTHYMPLMRMSWTNGAVVGYPNREYIFDKRLISNPPPLFPTTGPWQVSNWKDADPRCLSSANIGSPTCG